MHKLQNIKLNTPIPYFITKKNFVYYINYHTNYNMIIDITIFLLVSYNTTIIQEKYGNINHKCHTDEDQ
jgi:hypothetical protein